MEFLKEILGEELFNQFVSKVNEYNGNEANKDNQIKLANLGTGEYVGKGKYDALQETLTGKETELTNANNLIAQLEKTSKGNEAALQQINDYKVQNEQLQEELKQTKIQSAVKVALLSENAVDVNYLTFKLTELMKKDGRELELDDTGESIKGWDSLRDTLKNQCPNMFETGGGGGYEPLDNKGLPKGGGEQTVTKEQFAAMSYEERVALKQKNEKLYNTLRG